MSKTSRRPGRADRPGRGEANPPAPPSVRYLDGTVMAAFPSPGTVHLGFHESMLNLLLADTGQRWRNLIPGHLASVSGANICKARNRLVREFLHLPERPEWFWSIDTDMVFPPDVLRRLLTAAETAGARIIGGLCVMEADGSTAVLPTCYEDHPTHVTRVMTDVAPGGQVVEVAATGAACLLVHRSVLEDIHARIGGEYAWYRERVVAGRWVGEDIGFCLLARELGHRVFVDTSTHIGHAKGNRTLWPADYFAQRARYDATPSPTVAVIPVKDRLELTRNLLEQLLAEDAGTQVVVVDNGSTDGTRAYLDGLGDKVTVLDMPDVGIHDMWNAGAEHALALSPKANIAFLNNDITLSPGALSALAGVLRTHPQLVAVSPNYDGRHVDGDYQPVTDICAGRYDGTGGLAGFAFMVKGEWFAAGYRFPTDCKWWYGDNDLVLHLTHNGVQVGITDAAQVTHLNGGSGTGDWDDPAMAAQLAADRDAFLARWRLTGAA